MGLFKYKDKYSIELQVSHIELFNFKISTCTVKDCIQLCRVMKIQYEYCRLCV